MGCSTSRHHRRTRTKYVQEIPRKIWIDFGNWEERTINRDLKDFEGDFLLTKKAALDAFSAHGELPERSIFKQKCNILKNVAEQEDLEKIIQKIIFLLRKGATHEYQARTSIAWRTLLVLTTPISEIGRKQFYSEIQTRVYSEDALVDLMCSLLEIDESKRFNGSSDCTRLMKAACDALSDVLIFSRLDYIGEKLLEGRAMSILVAKSGLLSLKVDPEIISQLKSRHEEKSKLSVFYRLPGDIQKVIFGYLDQSQRVKCSQVCALWRSLLLDSDRSMAFSRVRAKHLRIIALWMFEPKAANKITEEIGVSNLVAWLKLLSDTQNSISVESSMHQIIGCGKSIVGISG
eukprot:TRINITY_DN6842_c0_g1_i3.p1 TRINITY_DN6842_c0_g1~~TRINITY_DN6842_c0_g1_i3.p1  ORF type:complete len:370 (-),score=86.38 TRINITY_DN6842_c0_g1_i3:521-1561(-)